MFSIGSSFDCECRPTSAAAIFREFDTNNDDMITLEEVFAYFDTQDCVFPFKYALPDGTVKEYTSCTTDDDEFGFEWCSIRTLSDGFSAEGFFKYCKIEDNEAVWFDAIDHLDENGDGLLSFDEAINPSRRNLQFIASTEQFCNDCTAAPTRCANPLVNLIDGTCRNFIKTTPLGDDELIRILADAMADAYCPETYLEDSYMDCPTQREGAWLARVNVEEYVDPPGASSAEVLSCLTITNAAAALAGAVFDGLASFWGVNVQKS